MNEIEKLYKNAGIKKKYCGWLDMGDLDCQMQYVTCNSINEWNEAVFSSRFGETEEEPELKYPEFTAEKQLEIVKMILFSTWWLNLKRLQFSEKFDEGLAQMINYLWQDLTDEERKQIKDILE